jgi:histone-lysine N-methyltransferase SETMAR
MLTVDFETKPRTISPLQFSYFKLITSHLFNRGYSREQVHEELSTTYHGFCPVKKTIFSWYDLYLQHSLHIEPAKRYGRPKKVELLQILKSAVETNRFASQRFLAKEFGVDHKTVAQKMKELDLRQMKVQTIPHTLLPSHIEKRMEMAEDLASFLLNQEKENFSRVFTGDETWILYNNASKVAWTEKGQFPSPREEISISSKKILLTVFFNGERIWHFSFLPAGETMDGEKFVSSVLKPLDLALRTAKSSPPIPWFLHFDNARPDVCIKTSSFLKTTSFIKLDAPPYSPDLSPSDFYLFGSLKRQLRGTVFVDENDLKERVSSILTGLGSKDLQPVFREWKQRCLQVAQTGEYFKKEKE